ncbi:MAG: hypothetical protein ACLFS6_02025 [Methanomassiliicoccales archaeon]
MTRGEVEALLERIKGADSDGDMISLWEEGSPGPGERGEAVRIMASTDLWYWLPLISHILKGQLCTEEFPALARELGSHVGPHLAGEVYWKGLIEAGEEHPREAMECAMDLLEDREEVTAVFASALLAGVARREPGRIRERASELLSGREKVEWSAALRALNVALREGSLSPSETVDTVTSLPVPEDPDLQSVYSMSLRLVHAASPKKVEERYRELIDSSDEWVRMQVFYDISVVPGVSEELLEHLRG